MPGLPPHKAVRLMLIGGLLCLSALLLPVDLSLTCSYQRPQASSQADASLEAVVCEESGSSGDELCAQERWEGKQHYSLLPFLLVRLPRPGRAERPAASTLALVPVRFFPRKISPPTAPDDPYLS